MDVADFLSARSRRAAMVMCVAVLVGFAGSARAQDAAAPQEDPLKFSRSEPVMIIYQILPDRAMDFERAWRTIKDTLVKSPNMAIQQFASTFNVLRVETPAGSPAIYVFDIPSPSMTYSYNPVTILYTTLQETEKVLTYDEATEIWKLLEGSWENITPWPMQPVS